MNTENSRIYILAAWSLIVGLTIFRIFYSGAFLLVADETNYWQWGRHLALGYHDNSPMIGWAIRFSTELLGQTETAVRLPSILSMSLACLFLVSMASRYINPSTAFNTALLTQGILEFNVGGLLATTDALQAAGWAGTSYFVIRGYESGKWSHWLLAGFWFGFGILSKYTMVIFLPGAFIFGLLSNEHRKRLFSIRPYIGLLLGFLMFLPVIYWNAVNGWKSVRHVAHIGGADESFAVNLKYFGDYLGSQAALLSPLVFLLIIFAWINVFRKDGQQWIYKYLFWTSFPMITMFAILSLHTRVYGNWPGAGYLTASVLAAAFYARRKSSKDGKPGIGQRLWPWVNATSYLLTAVLLAHVVWPILPLPKHLDRVASETVGWKHLGTTAGMVMKAMPRQDRTFLFGDSYQLASELAFYTPGQPQTVSINKWRRPNVYDYWREDKDILGWDAVGVTIDSRDHKAKLIEVFERVDDPIKVEAFRDSIFSKAKRSREPANIFYVYRAYGFKGGLRWQPKNKSDIRAGSR
jgi:undecaprenyl-diphosphatase